MLLSGRYPDMSQCAWGTLTGGAGAAEEGGGRFLGYRTMHLPAVETGSAKTGPALLSECVL